MWIDDKKSLGRTVALGLLLTELEEGRFKDAAVEVGHYISQQIKTFYTFKMTLVLINSFSPNLAQVDSIVEGGD